MFCYSWDRLFSNALFFVGQMSDHADAMGVDVRLFHELGESLSFDELGWLYLQVILQQDRYPLTPFSFWIWLRQDILHCAGWDMGNGV